MAIVSTSMVDQYFSPAQTYREVIQVCLSSLYVFVDFGNVPCGILYEFGTQSLLL